MVRSAKRLSPPSQTLFKSLKAAFLSAQALGEAFESSGFPPDEVAAKLAFVKYGSAGCWGDDRDLWQLVCSRASLHLSEMNASCRVVVAAYADWKRCRAPSPTEACRFACELGVGAFLLDTWGKDGSTLVDWIALPEIEDLCQSCHGAGIPIALAGSLGLRQIEKLLPLQPDWIAVRGAACRRSDRNSVIDLDKVRALAALMAATPAG